MWVVCVCVCRELHEEISIRIKYVYLSPSTVVSCTQATTEFLVKSYYFICVLWSLLDVFYIPFVFITSTCQSTICISGEHWALEANVLITCLSYFISSHLIKLKTSFLWSSPYSCIPSPSSLPPRHLMTCYK